MPRTLLQLIAFGGITGGGSMAYQPIFPLPSQPLLQCDLCYPFSLDSSTAPQNEINRNAEGTAFGVAMNSKGGEFVSSSTK